MLLNLLILLWINLLWKLWISRWTICWLILKNSRLLPIYNNRNLTIRLFRINNWCLRLIFIYIQRMIWRVEWWRLSARIIMLLFNQYLMDAVVAMIIMNISIFFKSYINNYKYYYSHENNQILDHWIISTSYYD